MRSQYLRYERHLAGLGKRPPKWALPPERERHREEEWLPRDLGARILDLGCGYGDFLYELYHLGYRSLEGVDATPEVAETAARAAGDRAKIWCEDARTFLTQRPSSYDLITLFSVLEHFGRLDGARLLKKVRNALKPGGRAVFFVPNMANLSGAFYFYSDLTHRAGYTEVSLREALEAADFGAVTFCGLSAPIQRNGRLRRPWAGAGIRARINESLHRALYWLQGQTPVPSQLGANLCAYASRSSEEDASGGVVP